MRDLFISLCLSLCFHLDQTASLDHWQVQQDSGQDQMKHQDVIRLHQLAQRLPKLDSEEREELQQLWEMRKLDLVSR